MRTAHWKAHLLPLLLLSLYSVSVCLAIGCSFDEYMSKFGPLNVATPIKQRTSNDWEPIRIVASTKDLKVPSDYCISKDGSVRERNKKKPDPDCTAYFDTVSEEQNKIVLGILARAIPLHTDRLLVQRAVGPLLVPDFSTHRACRYFNVPKGHGIIGVPNADMVLYVAFTRYWNVDVGLPSIGLTCAKSGGRPIVGALTFGSENTEISRTTVRIAAHQIAHALGFNYGEMKLRNMIVDKKVREKTNLVAVVKSDKTKEMTRAHYGCPTAEDMELEDGEKNDKKTLSHWERRNAKDELMATPLRDFGISFMGFYANITLAAFEDMGYYKANFQMAEHMEYGHKTGCKFLDGKCMDKGATEWPNMFCNAPGCIEGSDFCTTDRLGLAHCVILTSKTDLPLHFQYFALPNKGGDRISLTDHCPVVEPDSPFGCQKTEQAQGTAPGSLFGTNSMCLDANALKVNTNKGSVPVSAVCAEISCEGGSVRVKYLGDNNTWHKCPEGKTLTPSTTSDSFVSGEIKCPKYKEVCTVALDGSSLVPKKVVPEPTTPPIAKRIAKRIRQTHRKAERSKVRWKVKGRQLSAIWSYSLCGSSRVVVCRIFDCVISKILVYLSGNSMYVYINRKRWQLNLLLF